LQALTGESLGEQRQEVLHRRPPGELVVAALEEPLDRLSREHPVELAA
jgi:hypothetical protein